MVWTIRKCLNYPCHSICVAFLGNLIETGSFRGENVNLQNLYLFGQSKRKLRSKGQKGVS